MDLWRVLTKAWDPFGVRARDEEEDSLLRELSAAEAREAALLTARSRGEDVADKLGRVRDEIRAVNALMPRGYWVGYILLVVFLVLFLIFLFRLHPLFVEIHEELYGPRDSWQDNEWIRSHRLSASRIVLAGAYIAEELWPAVVLVVFIGMAGLVQRKLQRRHARWLVWSLLATLLLAGGTLIFFGDFSMLIGPLITSI